MKTTTKQNEPEIRVSAGKYKGKKLLAPEIEGFRSVQDKAKQAVFSIIEPQNIQDSTCLDLFSGSGVMGIEALSRGAAFVDFVDNNYTACGKIMENTQNCEIESYLYEIHLLDSSKFVIKTDKTYDFIFCDPFYNDTKHKHLFQNISQVLTKKGYFIFFHSVDFDPKELAEAGNLKTNSTRKFGKLAFTIFTK